MQNTADTAAQPFTADASQPFVTVIIPVLNEEGFIGRCLQALAAQDYPKERTEVIVLDGGSTDATEYETQKAAEAAGLTVFFAPNPNRTTAAGRNLGLTLAHGDVIIHLDGHARVAPGFISANVQVMRESGADAVGGPIETRGHGVIGRAIALAMSSSFGIGDTAFRHVSAGLQETDSVPFGAYRRDVFERVGQYDEDMNRGEDDEFNYRLRAAGGRIVLSPEIRSVYFCRDTLQGLARQYWGYGLAKAGVLGRHPVRMRPRHLIPSALVVTLGGGALLTMLDRRLAWIPALAGGAYAIAAGLASWRIASKGNKPEARYLPAAFACIHLPAGAGMLVGLIRARMARKSDG